MSSIRHPYSQHLYVPLPDGTVRVEGPQGSGHFTRSGVWLDGELRIADPEFCRWIASEVLLGRMS